jgi:AcrR family transcriptional regulator
MARSPGSRSGRRGDPTDRIGDDVDRKVAATTAKVRAKLDAAEARTTARLAAADAKTAAKLAAADRKVAAAQAKISAKTAATGAGRTVAEATVHHAGAHAAAALGRVAAHLDALDLWTRSEPGARKPRLGRAELASVAIRVADAEGIDAVSMRRIATELEVGTMTLYHYVRTKDELLALMVDHLLDEVLVPADELASDWRVAMTAIAHRSRDALRGHPWVFDVAGDPSIGPNAMRHLDQSWRAVAGLDADLDTKLDVISAVDEYVFGFCLAERRGFVERDGAEEPGMVAYMEELLADGDYPALRMLTAEVPMPELWSRMQAHAADDGRFERNLERLLSGFADGPSARVETH